MTEAACADSERVSLRFLNQKYGLPVNTVGLTKNLYPTIPTEYVNNCKMGVNFLHSLPIDVQSMLIACIIVSHRATKSKIPPIYGKPFNHGVSYGDVGFKPLASFRTL